MHSQRIIYLDACKAFGIYLVYYGHFIEKLYFAGTKFLFLELKLIYSFHVPLFFFLAGILWKQDNSALWVVFFKKVKTRLLPVVFFSLITIPFFLLWDKLPINLLLEKVKFYYIGQPKLNWVTWFLICLFSLELMLAVLSNIIQLDRLVKVPAFILLLFIVGWLSTETPIRTALANKFPINIWFLNEAFVACGFYLTGFWVRPILEKTTHWFFNVFGCITTGALLTIFFNLNQGPFFDKHAIVLMNASSHGNYILFIGTAFLGIAMIIFLSRLISYKEFKSLNYIGRNTLLYMGLNGICLHFLDVKVIYKIGYFPDNLVSSNIYAFIYVAIVMTLFIPVIWILKKTVPKWIIPVA